MGSYVCNLCRDKGEEFRVTADRTGGHVMNAHFRDKHPELNFEPVNIDRCPPMQSGPAAWRNAH